MSWTARRTNKSVTDKIKSTNTIQIEALIKKQQLSFDWSYRAVAKRKYFGKVHYDGNVWHHKTRS